MRYKIDYSRLHIEYSSRISGNGRRTIGKAGRSSCFCIKSGDTASMPWRIFQRTDNDEIHQYVSPVSQIISREFYSLAASSLGPFLHGFHKILDQKKRPER